MAFFNLIIFISKIFSDPYWSSRDESFVIHILRLMKSWCTVCDVYFLAPQKLQPGETPVEFANRVKGMICKKANLASLNWDGMMKYYQPSEKFKKDRQRVFAELLKKSLMTTNKLSGSSVSVDDKKVIGLSPRTHKEDTTSVDDGRKEPLQSPKIVAIVEAVK